MDKMPIFKSPEKLHTPELSAHERLLLDLRNALSGLENEIQNSPIPGDAQEYLVAIGTAQQSLLQAIYEVNKLRAKEKDPK